MSNIVLDANYDKFLLELKDKVATSQYRAARSVNKELVILYHHIGQKILESQKNSDWGSKIVERLSKDLRKAFPEIKGFSERNLKYMRKFAQEYPDIAFVQEALAQITWYHNICLMDKVKDKDIRLFYIKSTIEHGWSSSILVMQIESKLHERQNKAITNFKDKLPSPQSDLAQYTLKDPYIFDFLSLGEDAKERDVERSLISHMEKFLIELGSGFSFVGRQYHLDIGEQDFYVDLLFYHLKLRCFIVIELKDKDFKPEYAGKMNFYLSVVDDHLKHETDNPSIGLILCKSKNNALAEYTLRDMTKPIGLAEYKLGDKLPKELQKNMPTIAELEKQLTKGDKLKAKKKQAKDDK